MQTESGYGLDSHLNFSCQVCEEGMGLTDFLHIRTTPEHADTAS